MGDNVFDTPDFGEVLDDENGDLIGYSCIKTVQRNVLTDIDVVFYVDLAYPAGESDAALKYFQTALVTDVSKEYGISDGERCEFPPFDGTSWVVQFISSVKSYSRVEVFDSCRQLQHEPTLDCFVYEIAATGSVIGVTDIPDVEDYIESILDGDALTLNSPYSVGFLGAPTVDQGTQDQGRDNLGEPSNINTPVETLAPGTESNKVTIYGALFVAAFGAALLGILLVVWLRRRSYLKAHEFQPAELDNNFDTDLHISDEPSSYDIPEEGLGIRYKDQLMGLHGHQAPRRPNNSNTIDPYAGMFGDQMPSDAFSDSDVDSWAQTDGTIGSLELQLEPITAEV